MNSDYFLQKALEYSSVLNNCCAYVKECVYSGECHFGTEYASDSDCEERVVFQTIKEALEKQTQQTPDVWGDGYADGSPVYDSWDCPRCGWTYELDTEQYEYCPNCGQRINWEGAEGNETSV